METPESRRRAGALIAAARKRQRISQRELARRADISEVWLRGMTVGLGGDDPQRANDDTWLALARASGADVTEVFAALGRPLPEWASKPTEAQPSAPHEMTTETRITRTDFGTFVDRIVRDAADELDDMTDEEAEESIQRVIEELNVQTRNALDRERRRVERERERRAESEDPDA